MVFVEKNRTKILSFFVFFFFLFFRGSTVHERLTNGERDKTQKISPATKSPPNNIIIIISSSLFLRSNTFPKRQRQKSTTVGGARTPRRKREGRDVWTRRRRLRDGERESERRETGRDGDGFERHSEKERRRGSSIRGRGGVRATDELERGFVGADRMRGAIRVVFVDEITAVMPSPAARAQMMRENGDGGSDAFGAGNELETTSFSAAGGENFGEETDSTKNEDDDFEDDYRYFRPVSRFQSDDFGDDYSYEDYDGDEGVDSRTTSTSETKEERQMDAAEQWLGDHHNKFFKNVVKELSMDEDGWERAAKKQFAMRKEIIKDAANMKKMEGYRSMIVLALEVATAIGALVSFKNWVESDIYIRDVIDLRQIVPKIPDKSNLLPVRERPTRPTAELVKKDISKLTTEELKAQLALLKEQKR